MAIGVKARKPTVDWPPLRIVRFSGTAFTFGIEEHVIENVAVRITSREKTVADCFKYRNKVGLDVALEALRDYLRSRRRSVDALMEAAAASRVQNVIRPYIEAIDARFGDALGRSTWTVRQSLRARFIRSARRSSSSVTAKVTYTERGPGPGRSLG